MGRRRVAPQGKVTVGKAAPLAEIGPAIGLPDKQQAGEPHQHDGEHKPDARALLRHPQPKGQQGQHEVGGTQRQHEAQQQTRQRYLALLQSQERAQPGGQRRPV